MKKQFLLFVAAVLISTTSLMAQDARQKHTPEERTKVTMEKLAVLNLDADHKVKVEGIFNDFYAAQQKSMQEMRTSGSTDREAMKEKHRQLASDRDTKLKAILTADQMNKWTNEIEPSLRMQKPAGSAMPAPATPGTTPPAPAN